MNGRISEELLDQMHQFPTKYMFKLVGPGDEGYIDEVVNTALEAVSDPAFVSHSVRRSESGKHISVTVEVKVATAREIVLLYDAFAKVPRTLMLL